MPVPSILPALSPRLRRTVAWLLGAFALLLLLAWLGLPPLVRAVAQQQLGQQLGRQVTLGAVRFNPFTLTLRIEQLAVAGARAGEAPLLELGAAEVNADLRSVLRGAPVLESLSLQSPRLRLARLADGRYDIDDLLARWAQRPRSPEPDTGPPRFALYNLSIRDGSIEFDDQPVGRRHRLEGLSLGLPVISTLDAAAIAIKVEPRLAFTLDGTAFDTGAQATPFSPERAGRLELRSGEVDLAGWLPYLPADLPLRPTGGLLALDLALEFAAPADAPPKAALSGQLRLQRLALSDAAGTPLLALPTFAAALLDVQPLKRRVALGEVEFQGLKLDLARDSRGQLNLLKALTGTSRQEAARSPGARAAGTAGSAASAAGGARAPAAQDAWQLTLARLALKDTQVHWQDASTRPAADLLLEMPLLQVEQMGWPVQASRPPTRWQVQAAWRDAGAADPAGSARLEGQLTDAGGQALLAVDQASLATGAPYLAQVITPRLSGQLSATLQAEWAGLPGETLPRLSLPNLTLADVQLTAPPADLAGRTHRPGNPAGLRARPMASLQQLELQGLAVDLDRRRVTLRGLRLGQPRIDLQRHADGTLNLQQWLAERPAEAAASGLPQAGAASAAGRTEAAAPSAWQLELAELAVTGGQVGWRDEAPAAGPVQLELSSLRLGAKGVAWPAVPSRPLKLQGSAQLGAARADGSVDRGALARLEWNGQLGLTPVAWRGSAKVERFPVHAVAPYLGAQWPVDVVRAEAGWAGDLSLALLPQGPSVQASGDARLTDLRLQARRGAAATAAPDDTGAELLSWQSLALDKVKLNLQPGGRPQVDIGQVVLADFFAKLLITEQGRLNLTDLAPPPADAGPAAAPGEGGSGAAAVPAAQQVQAVAAAASGPPGPAPEAGGWPLDLAVGGVELRGGRVDFTDRFIRPHYSADLSRLEGRLGPFRSGAAEPATLALTGRVAGTALLDVRGSLNPMARPLALDVQARATDLELAPLSPYAAKYAGYAIERGKLSMDVSYRIQPDGQLQARNQIVLNQLTFGDKVESPTATKLPVLLAVSLLKDRHGVIDLDLPIGGSINDPEFSVGGVIVKVILNLLTKALMAPFSLFSGGDSTDLSQVPFVPGTATLAPAALPALDKVAQALQDRPALKMTVTGLSDPQAEADAIRSALLEARLQTERRQERVRAGQSAASAPEALGTEERQRLIQRVYADTRLPDKPRNLIGLAKDIPVAEMEARLKAAYPVNADTARELALQRALAVRDALIAKGLANERLFLAAPKLRMPDAESAATGAPAAAESAAWAPSAQLSLGTQ